MVLLRDVAAVPRPHRPRACGDTPRATLEDRGTEQPENMTEQADSPSRMANGTPNGTIAGFMRRAPHQMARLVTNTYILQRFSHMKRVERVTGIEPALSAWEEFLSSRVSVSCNDIGGLN